EIEVDRQQSVIQGDAVDREGRTDLAGKPSKAVVEAELKVRRGIDNVAGEFELTLVGKGCADRADGRRRSRHDRNNNADDDSSNLAIHDQFSHISCANHWPR